MTKTEFDALKMVVPGAMPFAAGDNATVTPAGATAGDFSMPDGFGSAFDAAPTADGSNMVQRGQMNFIGKMASYAPFMGQAGRDFWGFDPNVCVALGGYPKDAILTLVRDGCYLKIISLQDDNKVDFTGQTDTTQTKYADIVNGTVDGVNWQYLSLDPQTLIDQSILAEIPDMTIPRQNQVILGCFKANNNGALVVSGSVAVEDLTPGLVGAVNTSETTKSTTSEKTEVSSANGQTSGQSHMSFRLVVSEGRPNLFGSYDDNVGLDGWGPVDTSSQEPNGKVIYGMGTSFSCTITTVEAGKWYALGLDAIYAKLSASTMKVKIAVG